MQAMSSAMSLSILFVIFSNIIKLARNYFPHTAALIILHSGEPSQTCVPGAERPDIFYVGFPGPNALITFLFKIIFLFTFRVDFKIGNKM